MAPVPRRRALAGVLAGSLLLSTLGALLPGTASAATTQLFNQPFHNATADGDGAVVLPAASSTTVTNVACLTAPGNTTVVPRSCTTTNDTAGTGKLRLTPNTTSQAGGLFAATSVPTSQGLDVTFNTYQYGGGTTPADGIAFALAAVDPTNPLSPPNMGPVGGALGYTYGNGARGLAYGYLGIGFDIYGNYSNSAYQGTTAAPGSTAACTNPAYISPTGQVKGQVVVRGPGNGSVGYCALNSTATSTTSSAVALRASTRAASRVPVEVVINPATTSVTTPSGITVGAKSYTVQFTPVGGTARTLSGSLPTVNAALYPSNYLDSSGYPKQLAFGFVGSTGSLTDFHEIDEAKVVSLNAVPELTVAQTAYTQPTLSPGDPVSYVVRTGVAAGATETAAVSVTDTLPAGVTPTGGYGSGWVCATPVGQKITCTNSSTPFAAGSTLPNLTITGTVTGTGVTPAVIQSNSIVTASSNDANPAYSSTAAAGTPTVAPANLAISPASGPAGTSVTITGTNTSAATAVQIGTSAELAAGTATTYTQCANNTAATGCFTINATTGALGISAMPAHAIGAVQVKVITLGSAATVAYTYTSVPGTPTVSATAGVTSASLTWEAPASGGSAITGYVLTPYKDGVAQTPISYGATATSANLTGLTAGSSYTFTLAARNVNGIGVASQPTAAVVPYTVPGAPTIGTVTAGSSAATVRWTAPTSTGSSPVTGYVVTPYLNGVAQPSQSFDSTATSQVVTGLTPGGSYTFRVSARNAAGLGADSATSAAVTVNQGPSVTSTPPAGEVTVAYQHQFTVANGTGPFTFSASGDLPAGLTLSSTGLLSGTPTTEGSSTFTVRVTDSYGATSTRTVTVDVAAAPSLTFVSPLPRADVGRAYSEALTRTGGTGPFTFSVSSGSLPAGLSLNAGTGVLSGTPTTGGSYSFTVRVVDALGVSDTKQATLLVRAAPAVDLATSAGSVRLGTDVTLTSTLDPGDATGTVTFTDVSSTGPDAGTSVELGQSSVRNGVATLTVTLPSFGAHTIRASYGGDAEHLGARSGTQVVEVRAVAGQAIITEFRTSGPAGADDSYVEIYNTGPAMPLAGFVLESSSGVRTVLPDSAPVLGTYRTYLVAGADFSLGALATPDQQPSSLGTGGYRLLAPDTAATLTDAVGPGSGFHLGDALPALSGTPTGQWAFVRIETAGRPDNTSDNADDFALVSSTGGLVGGVQSMRGSASPTGLADPWQHNTQALSYLLDSTERVEAVPNRAYVVGSPGTLEVRRTITNTGTTTITSAKARITALSEANGLPYRGTAPAKVALIRAVNPRTPTSSVSVAGRGTVTVRNLSVDSPITAAAGGGLNSTFTIPLPSGGLAPGASVDVAFTFDVDTRGTFWFGYDVDARTGSAPSLRAGTSSKVTQAQVQRTLEKAGKTPSKAVAKVTTGTL